MIEILYRESGRFRKEVQRRYGLQPSVAQDVVQDAFVRLIRMRSTITSVDHGRRWLFLVSGWLAANEKRRYCRGAAREIPYTEVTPETAEDVCPVVPDELRSPSVAYWHVLAGEYVMRRHRGTRRKLSKADIMEIRKLRRRILFRPTLRELAARYQVHPSTISAVLARRR